jgi:hypothetical protein
MAWRVAKSLLGMRDQFNASYPRRNRSSDGTIGDAKHATRSSDHNPWVKDGKTGIVTALDITHDPANGVNTHQIADYLRVKRDPRIKYVISNHRIWSSVQSPFTWRKYTGSNPHVNHMHVSVHSQKSHYDSEKPWDLFAVNPVPPVDPDSPAVRPLVKRGSTGPFVVEVQTVLDIRADGIFGPITEEAVKRFQRGAKLTVDGIVGPKTWQAMDRIEQRNNGEHDGDLFEGEPS